MPDRIACAHCGVVGLVRRERVFRGEQAYTDYYCGHCEHAWQIAEHDERRQSPRPARRAGAERGTGAKHRRDG